MTTTRSVALATVALLLCSACAPEDYSNRDLQANKASEAAESIHFNENAEIDNIKKRLQLTADPGKLGFIMLLNQAGQPILYEGVVGKVTSGGKRLREPDRIDDHYGIGRTSVKVTGYWLRAAPSDEGTWGNSNPYIYYWNTDGTYRQWSGDYLYSDQPIRLRVEPLVITTK